MDQLVVDQVMAITGADEPTARNLLEASAGDVSLAVDLHLNGQQQHNASNNNDNNIDDDVIPVEQGESYRAPISTSSGVLVEETFRSSYEPRRRRPNADSVFDKFRDFKAETEAQRQRLQGLKTGDEGKRNTLESMFRPPLDLMYTGSFESAKKEALGRNNWLLVNVQKVDEFQCQIVNRDVWNNKIVKEIVQSNFVFWQVYHDSACGVRFRTYYKVTNYPFVCVCDPRTGEMIVQFNCTDNVAFCDIMTSFLTDRPTPSIGGDELGEVSPYVESQPCTSSSTHFESLARPIIHHKRRASPMEADSGAKSAKMDTDNPVLSRESPAYPENAKVNDDLWKQYISYEGSKVTFLFRFADGKRDKLTIGDESYVKAILLYLESMGYNSEIYEMLLNYPKRSLNNLTPTMTIKQAGLNSQETVFVDTK